MKQLYVGSALNECCACLFHAQKAKGFLKRKTRNLVPEHRRRGCVLKESTHEDPRSSHRGLWASFTKAGVIDLQVRVPWCCTSDADNDDHGRRSDGEVIGQGKESVNGWLCGHGWFGRSGSLNMKRS